MATCKRWSVVGFKSFNLWKTLVYLAFCLSGELAIFYSVLHFFGEMTVIDRDLFVVYFVYDDETGWIYALLESRPL